MASPAEIVVRLKSPMLLEAASPKHARSEPGHPWSFGRPK